MVLKLNITIFGGCNPCSVVNYYRRFGGTYISSSKNLPDDTALRSRSLHSSLSLPWEPQTRFTEHLAQRNLVPQWRVTENFWGPRSRRDTVPLSGIYYSVCIRFRCSPNIPIPPPPPSSVCPSNYPYCQAVSLITALQTYRVSALTSVWERKGRV
jgi:hypothetical protein